MRFATPLLVLLSSVFPAHTLLAETAGWLDDWELSGYLEVEGRVFPETPADSRQFEAVDGSFALEPELFRRWDDAHVTFRLIPFLRLDAQDDQRTHFDLRELMVVKSADAWELQAGVGKVFWGVTESQHLVDVVNQTDFVENIDSEEKLGQPLISFSWITQQAGTLSLFYLPYTRERTFPGTEGRLRPQPPVDDDRPLFESGLENWHPDMTLRWAHAIGEFDLGTYYFYGTSRDPIFTPSIRPSGAVRLRPTYNLMHQAGVDAQWTHEAWLLKFEGIARDGLQQHFQAIVSGFEYTFYGLFETSADIGLLGEYHFDSRWNDALTSFNHDLFAGTRLTLNDTQDTTFLGGVFFDHENHSTSARIEFERRLGSRYTLELQGQWFASSDADDLSYAFRRDSFLSLALRRYF